MLETCRLTSRCNIPLLAHKALGAEQSIFPNDFALKTGHSCCALRSCRCSNCRTACYCSKQCQWTTGQHIKKLARRQGGNGSLPTGPVGADKPACCLTAAHRHAAHNSVAKTLLHSTVQKTQGSTAAGRLGTLHTSNGGFAFSTCTDPGYGCMASCHHVRARAMACVAQRGRCWVMTMFC